MKLGSVETTGNGNLFMRLTDDGGIEVKSDKKIVLDKGKIEGKKILKIKENSKSLIVIRLDITESLF